MPWGQSGRARPGCRTDTLSTSRLERGRVLPVTRYVFMSHPGRASLLVALCCACLLLVATPLRAEEEINEEEPIPSSVEQITGPMERFGEVKPRRPGLFPWIKEQLKDTSPFFRDTRMDLKLRSYYSRAGKYDASVTEAWALGGGLAYQSGWLLDRVSVGAAVYTSQPAYAPVDSGGSGVLPPDQSGVTVLGQLYGRVRLWDQTFANLYRYGDYKTPFLSKDDGKMLPYTFEGYAVQGVAGGKDGAPRFNFGGGYFTKIKDKTADTFIWMSQKAGAEVKRGVWALGGLYTHGGFTFGAIDYYSDDVINIAYGETTYTMNLGGGCGLRLASQYTDQRSVGSELLTGSPFSTRQMGFKGDLSYGGVIFTLAFTSNSRGYDIQKPWSGNPGYTGAMITNYLKAGYTAWYAKLSYDFSRLGLEGVAAYLLVTHGWDQVDKASKEPLPGENELNADLQWRPEWGWLKGLWFRLRYGVAHQYEGEQQYTHDGRVIVHYDFPLL